MNKIKICIVDFVNGIYSGIPLCCVICYCVEDWKWINIFDSRRKEYTKEKLVAKHWGYIPCRSCVKNNKIVKVKQNGNLL